MPGTRKLGKTTDQRKAMHRQQVTDFLDNGRMETTVGPLKRPTGLVIILVLYMGTLCFSVR